MTTACGPIMIFLGNAIAGLLISGIVYASQLEGIDWRLLEIGGAAKVPLAGKKKPSLKLDAAQKKATGYSGCNNFFSTYNLDGASLTFGPIGMTRRACPDPETGVETAVLKVLDRTRGWKLEADELLLIAGNEVLARFSAGREDIAAIDPGSLSYRLTSMPSGRVTLVRGQYRAPAAPGSASEIITTLTDKRAFGSVHGRESGAVVLATSLGGSGTFYELALLSRGAKGWENADTVLLGDRVNVHRVGIENDHVVVSMTAHGPQDPSCCPTLEVTKRFAIKENRLVPETEGAAAGEGQIIGPVWQWVRTIFNNDTKTVPDKPENYTVRFLENGTIAVKADCNQKGGTYTKEAKKLAIKITHSTMAACEPGSLEDTFVRDLTGGAGFFFKDGDLFIDLKYDTGTMRFSRP